jgi:plastocyanin
MNGAMLVFLGRPAETRSSRRIWIRVFAFLLAIAPVAVVTAASAGLHVSQNGRAFSVKEIRVAVGDVVHFDNDDEFIHQIYVKSAEFGFDSDESEPGNTIDVKFTKAGTFEVRCHIHPKMGLIVTVK